MWRLYGVSPKSSYPTILTMPLPHCPLYKVTAVHFHGLYVSILASHTPPTNFSYGHKHAL